MIIPTVRAAGFCVLFLISARVTAQARLEVFDFDENGKGTVAFPPSGVIAMFKSLGNITDPVDPANGLNPLAYDLSGSAGGGLVPVAGDVILTDLSAGGPVSDLLRFTDTGLLVVYSGQDSAGSPIHDLADVGIPASRQSNVLTLGETAPGSGIGGLIGYSPTPNQPGYLSGGATAVAATYNFTSDLDVPEPSSSWVLAALALLLMPWRRRRAVVPNNHILSLDSRTRSTT